MVQLRMAERGLPPFGPHALRHTFATRLLRTGQPVKTIADLLGHRSLASVSIYAKVDEKWAAAQAQKKFRATTNAGRWSVDHLPAPENLPQPLQIGVK